MATVESEARRALARLRRAVEKAASELASVDGALKHAEGSDFPATDFEDAAAHLGAVADFVEDQAERLQDKILNTGGIEPGRIRRTGGA